MAKSSKCFSFYQCLMSIYAPWKTCSFIRFLKCCHCDCGRNAPCQKKACNFQRCTAASCFSPAITMQAACGFLQDQKNNLMNLTIDKRVIEKASETSCMFNAVRCMCSFSGWKISNGFVQGHGSHRSRANSCPLFGNHESLQGAWDSIGCDLRHGRPWAVAS